MIVRTPLRLRFFGNARASAALTASIDKYVYVQLRTLPPVHSYKYRVVWDRLEQAQSAADLQQPIASALFQHYGSNVDTGYEALAGCDLPIGADFGANSAFGLSMLHAFFSTQGKTCSKTFLTSEAIRLQRDLLNQTHEAIDAAASAHGGLNRIEGDQERDVRITQVGISKARAQHLAKRLLLLCAKDVAKNEIIAEGAAQDRDIAQTAAHIEAGQKILENESAELDDFGRLLHEARLRSHAPSSKASAESTMDRLYSAAIGAGALGGQILGGGRALLFYVASENAAAVQTALPSYSPIPFSFEQDGASIVFQARNATTE